MEIYTLFIGLGTSLYYLFATAVLLISVLNFFDLAHNGVNENAKAIWAVVIALALIALKV